MTTQIIIIIVKDFRDTYKKIFKTVSLIAAFVFNGNGGVRASF